MKSDVMRPYCNLATYAVTLLCRTQTVAKTFA